MRLTKVAAIAVGTALGLASIVACSTSSHPAASAGNSGSSTTTAVAPTTGDGTSSSSDGTGTLAPEFASANCVDAFAAYTALYAEVGGFGTGADQGQLSDFEQKTADLEGKVPEAVRDDFRTVAAAYQQYAEAVKGLDFSNLLDSDTQSQLELANRALDDPAVKEAQGRIDDYFTHTCGS